MWWLRNIRHPDIVLSQPQLLLKLATNI